MSILLDVDICSAWVSQDPHVQGRLRQVQGPIFVSPVTITELEIWLLRPQTPGRYLQSYRALFQQLTQIDVDDAIARRAANVGSQLYSQGKQITTGDLLIAATALVHNLTLVTRNLPAFSGIPGLTIDDWLVP